MPRWNAPRTVGAVAGLLLAGALATGAAHGPALPLWPDGAGHDHAAHDHHTGLGFGMAQQSHLPLPWMIGEVDVHLDAATGTVRVAVLTLEPAGFVLVDGTDPARPRVVGWTPTGGYAADLKFSPDGGTLYVLLQGGPEVHPCSLATGLPPFPAVPKWRGTCGVQVWDVRDPAQPDFLRFLPTGSAGAHMMDVADLGGQRVLAFAGRGSVHGLSVAVEAAPQWPWLVGTADLGLVHDVTLAPDPLDPARPMAFVANLQEGVRLLDLTRPEAPVKVASWPVPEGDPGGYHTVMPLAFDGRRVVAAEQENAGRDWVSRVRFLDLTDPLRPRELGHWSNPDGHRALEGGLRWSTHNINTASGGRLVMAHYHGGVVVLDLATPDRLARPSLLGNFVPAGPASAPSPVPADAPFVWDAVPVEAPGVPGVVWLSDMTRGLFAASLP